MVKGEWRRQSGAADSHRGQEWAPAPSPPLHLSPSHSPLAVRPLAGGARVPEPTRFHPVQPGEPAEKPVLCLDDLIYPHRFDILARRDFLEFYDEHRALYRGDYRAFLKASAETDYGHYLREIRIPWKMSRRPGLPLLQTWRARRHYSALIRRFIAVYESIRQEGFRAESPLWIYFPIGTITTDSGRKFRRRAVLHNGCHRLAVLKRLGHTEIPPAHWRQRSAPPRVLADRTTEWIRTGRLDQEQYWRYLRDFYGKPEDGSLRELFANRAVELTRAPHEADPRLLELVHGLEVDWPQGAPLGWERPPEWFVPWQDWAAQARKGSG